MLNLKIHHRKRLISKRKKLHYGQINENTYNSVILNTPKRCSCWMCGNPRKYFNEITRGEKKSKLKYIDGCEDI